MRFLLSLAALEFVAYVVFPLIAMIAAEAGFASLMAIWACLAYLCDPRMTALAYCIYIWSPSLAAIAGFVYFVILLKRLDTNYKRAKKTGLSIIIVPINPQAQSWRIIAGVCERWLQKFERFRVIDSSLSWEDDTIRHAKYGENFFVVSPFVNILVTSDKMAVDEVLKKRKTFIKPKLYGALNIFGKNVNTVNDDDWTRHRKITAPCFNETASNYVWLESIRQSAAMVTHWLSQPEGNVSTAAEDARVIALHVLFAAGFGDKQDFHSGVRVPASGHALSHRDALMKVMNNLILCIMVPKEGLLRKVCSLFPFVQEVLSAMEEFRQYTDEAVAAERRLLSASSNDQKHHLMSTLLRTSDAAQAQGIKASGRLTDDEIRGNMFIFYFAGHDTTASTMTYAFALLAVYPEIQRWVDEEIDEVIGGSEIPEYSATHPRLKRVLAVMYETLRLYGPVPQIPRGTTSTETPLTVRTSSSQSTTIVLAPDTEVTLNLYGMHVSSDNFPSPKTWDPKRWIISPSPSSIDSTISTSTSTSMAGILAAETLLELETGFMPWSTGPRICPGMKFAQVEWTGVLSTLLRKIWIAPNVVGGAMVDAAKTRKEVLDIVLDSRMMGSTFSMKRPKELWLKAERR